MENNHIINGNGDNYSDINRHNGNSSFTSSANAIKHVIVMVGLPARGKTYISTKLCRYLNWIGVGCKVFNVGSYRREATKEYTNCDFFNPDNKCAMATREKVAREALDDALAWLENPGTGDAVIFDATNTTVKRRQWVYEEAATNRGHRVIFLESICYDQDVIRATLTDVKVHGKDYQDMTDKDAAMNDFIKRIELYKRSYVEVGKVPDEAHLSYMKIINAGEKMIMNKYEGRLHSRIAYWLMNIHIQPRSIYLTRHGESYLNVQNRIGGDGELTPNGQKYAEALGEYFNDLFHTNQPDGKTPNRKLKVWTSWLKRSIDTAAHIRSSSAQERWKALNEIDAGICEEMTYDEIRERYPEMYEERMKNKLTFRYPRGESYQDVITRLEAVIMELERQEDVLVVGHQAVLRCILSYFTDQPMSKMPYIQVPLHSLLKLTPVADGCEIQEIPFRDIPAVDTTHNYFDNSSSPMERKLTIPRIIVTNPSPRKD